MNQTRTTLTILFSPNFLGNQTENKDENRKKKKYGLSKEQLIWKAIMRTSIPIDDRARLLQRDFQDDTKQE